MRSARQTFPNLSPDRVPAHAAAPSQTPAGPAIYDSFVVRMWRTPDSQNLRRIEIEHVQSGVIASAGDVTPEWILAQFNHGLGDPPPGRILPPD